MARAIKAWFDFYGQERVIERLESMITGSLLLGRSLPPLLFNGPPGVGKTAIGRATAAAFGTSLTYHLAGPETHPGQLVTILGGMAPGDFLFIDEGHFLSRDSQKILLPALTDKKVPALSKDGVERKDNWISLADFTLIIATNLPSRLAKALRERMTEVVFAPYAFGELRAIALKFGLDRGIVIKGQAATRVAEVAAGSRDSLAGTPRRVGQLVDELLIHLPGKSPLYKNDVAWVFKTMLGIDHHGLWPHHRRYLLALKEGSCSLRRLAIILGQDPKYLEEEVEAHLFIQGFIEVTRNHGRVLTAKGRNIIADLIPQQVNNQEDDEGDDDDDTFQEEVA